MNERIREIALQAGWSSFESLDERNEKFAELIIKECIDQASISNGNGNNQWDRALKFAANNIKQHFGVTQ